VHGLSSNARDHAACDQLDGCGDTAGLGEQQCYQDEDLHGTCLRGDPVLSSTPTKAPGSVTRPTVLVESRLGNSALVADSLMTSMRESRSLIPRLSAASTSTARSLRVSNANRGGHRNGGHGAAEHDGNDGYDCHAGQRYDVGQQQHW